MRGPSRLLFASAIAALAAAAPHASANGKFPAAGQIVVHPSEPTTLFVRTTFGILVSRDSGATFDWICESGAGYAGNVDPGIAVTASGALLAGIVDGLDIGREGGCQWQLSQGSLAGRPIADVSVVKSMPTSAVALVVDPTGNIVFQTTDDAATWAQAGAPLPGSFRGITLDVAPSDPARFYVSGLDESAADKAILARSLDSGGSWETLPIAEASGRAPYLAAVDPKDPDIVYVRLDGTPGTLLVSKNAGSSWQNVFKIPGYIQAFALSPDGSTVLAGGPTDGLWRAPTGTFTFERISAMGVQCLSWSGDTVYACGTNFAVGRSKSAGESFESLLRLACIRGPLACDEASPVSATCPKEWPSLMVKIGSMYCDDDAGSAGGTGGSTSDAGAGGAGGSSAPTPSQPGCDCRAAKGAFEGGWGFLGLAAAAVGLWRRRAVRGS